MNEEIFCRDKVISQEGDQEKVPERSILEIYSFASRFYFLLDSSLLII